MPTLPIFYIAGLNKKELINMINNHGFDIETMIAWRRQLHRNPEVGFEVNDTAAFVAKKLRSFGIEVHAGIGQTGLVGVLTRGNSGSAIGLRADMDALLVQELNDFEHRSQNSGKMHACGHDGHTTMLLGAAQALTQQDFNGTVYFIFQPNEEHGLGAQAMIDDGLFERFPMQFIYGMHNMPGQPLGLLAMKSGAIMAGEDNFEIHIKGRGGHASQPHHHIDPLIVAAEIIQGLQTIVSRNIDPRQQAVVSVTEIDADGTVNVIPSNVVLKGDCRNFEVSVSQIIEQRMQQLTQSICEAHGAELGFRYERLFHATVNAEAPTEVAYQAALATVGVDHVSNPCEALTISEDFANMLRVKEGCYIFIGNGEDSEGGCMLHNPYYDFNDAILAVGARYWVNLVLQQLA